MIASLVKLYLHIHVLGKLFNLFLYWSVAALPKRPAEHITVVIGDSLDLVINQYYKLSCCRLAKFIEACFNQPTLQLVLVSCTSCCNSEKLTAQWLLVLAATRE